MKNFTIELKNIMTEDPGVPIMSPDELRARSQTIVLLTNSAPDELLALAGPDRKATLLSIDPPMITLPYQKGVFKVRPEDIVFETHHTGRDVTEAGAEETPYEKFFASALICIDIEAVGNWAERRNLAYSGYTDLSAMEEVYDLVQECVKTVNTDLARDEKLRGSQIKRYLLLHKELDADDGEITRTRKVRRRIIADKYGELIEALDDPQQTHREIESQMTFEDGRVGNVQADLQIREVAMV